MKQLQQQLIKDPEGADKQSIEDQLTQLRKDLVYIEQFPGDKKYISLFPSGGVSVSEPCTKKQEEIREQIIVKKEKHEKKVNQAIKLDVIKSDDFFVDPTAPVRVPKPKIKQMLPKQQQQHQQLKPVPPKPSTVHPSWDAKKNNEKLTGSIAGRKFLGNRLVFDDNE